MVRYRVELLDLSAHLLRVTLTVPAPAAEQELMLPVWIPGSYLVREFSRHISQLVASQAGRPVVLTQLDKHRWRASCSGRAALVLSYQVYAFDASVRTAWLDSRRGFFNPASVLLGAVGREAEEHRVALAGLPPGWQVATGLPEAGKNEYVAASYDALIDHPFELGEFWRGSFKAGGVTHEFVVAGAWPGFDGARLLADTQKICAAQIAFWHGSDKPPFDRYVFMLSAVDDGYGGLEHRNSTALICKRIDLPRTGMSGTPDGYVTLLGLISHEYFHTWNVKRLKPAEFVPYDLTRENYTELLWFFEGFTSYFDDIFLLRAGLIDEARYLKLVAKTITQVLATPGRKVQSVAEASFDAWIKYYRPDENTPNATVSYYTKGALIALALDLTLRREGERRRGPQRASLDALMLRLWQSSGAASSGRGAVPGGASKGISSTTAATPDGASSQGAIPVGSRVDGSISEADIAAALHTVGARSYAPELASWVHGTEDLPLTDLLAQFGVRWSHEASTLLQRLGLRLHEGGAAGGLRVQAVQRGGAAERAGLAAGDELLALGDWRIVKLDELVVLASALPRQAGRLSLLIARDRRLATLKLDLGMAEAPGATPSGTVQLAIDSTASAAQVRRRDAWLGRA
ncbi:MAG: M61 family metallopeptidase [Burkholderiales bacterium]|nr:M61 family metallopeptidase [Burkholderiales bacterium]